MAMLAQAQLTFGPSHINIQSQLDRNLCTLYIVDGVLIGVRRLYYNRAWKLTYVSLILVQITIIHCKLTKKGVLFW